MPHQVSLLPENIVRLMAGVVKRSEIGARQVAVVCCSCLAAAV
jgi:hypothetical protein